MSAGIQSVISLAKESTWGTAVTPTKSIPVRPTGGMEIKTNVQMIPGVMGRLTKYISAIQGKKSCEGGYTMDAFADYIGYFLLSAMGLDTPATHSGETVVFDHAFTEGVTKPSLTIEEAIGENVRRYAGSICTGFKLSGKPGEMLEFSPTMMAKTQATSTAITPAFTTVPAFDHTQLAVKFGGSTLTEIENIEIEYKNGLEMVYAVGNAEPAFNSINGGSEISGKIDLYLDSTTLTRLTNYIANTNESIELIATGTSVIGSAAHYVLDLLVEKAVYKSSDTKIVDSHNLLSIEFDGLYDTGSSKLLALTLTNLLSAY